MRWCLHTTPTSSSPTNANLTAVMQKTVGDAATVFPAGHAFLVAHLKRWRYNANAGNFDKLDQHVSFGLDFRPEHSVNYALRGVVAHSGPAGFGHYTAFARGPKEAQWHFYNDSSNPRAATTADVLAAQAYLLVYERA